MNFHPIDGFPSQNPPIYPKPTHGLQSLYPPPNPPPQFHQPIPPPNPNPKPPINPHHLLLHPPNPQIHPPPPPPPSSGYGGSSDYEQRLRDEVIYLHSLWHRGPPRTLIQSHFSHPQIRNPNLSNFNLKPNPPTTPFKKKKKKNKSIKSRVVSDKEWPVDPKPATASPTGWAEFKAAGRPAARPAPAEEQERVLAVRVHLKGLDSCIGFFNHDDDDDGGDDGEEEYDEEEMFEFFWGVFEGDEKLREYYKTKFENGEFYCLVCGVVAKQQLGRKYKNCVALVQHSVTISKTKKKIAHRGFGRAVCRVLGWDIDQLPSLASAISGCVSVNNNNVAVDETPKPGDSEPPVSQDTIPSH